MKNIFGSYLFLVLSLSLFLCQCHWRRKTNIPPKTDTLISNSSAFQTEDTIPNVELQKLMNDLLQEKNVDSDKAHQLVQNFFSKHPAIYFMGKNPENLGYMGYTDYNSRSVYFPNKWYGYDPKKPECSDFHLKLDCLKSTKGVNYILRMNYSFSYANETPDKVVDMAVFVIAKNKKGFKVTWQDFLEETSSQKFSAFLFKIINGPNDQKAIYYEWNTYIDIRCFAIVHVFGDTTSGICEVKSADIKNDTSKDCNDEWVDLVYKNTFTKLDNNGNAEFEMEYSFSNSEQLINYYKGLIPEKPVLLIHKKGKVVYDLSNTPYNFDIDTTFYNGPISNCIDYVIFRGCDPDIVNYQYFVDAFRSDLEKMEKSGTEDEQALARHFLRGQNW